MKILCGRVHAGSKISRRFTVDTGCCEFLAETYYHLDDRISALIIAQKAKEEGSRLMGTYRDAAVLDRLIEHLSSEPIAQ